MYKGNQRATEGDMEKIAITAKTGALGGQEEIEDVTKMSGV